KPIFNSVGEAVEATGADVSIMYVPAKFAKGGMLDAADSELKILVAITEGIPTLDVLEAYEVLSEKGIRLIGPNCSGIITPGSMDSSRYIIMDASGLPGTISNIRSPAPRPAATGGFMIPHLTGSRWE
ncbi:MAG: hypothetical protein IIB38_09095, partial [Candidatus Hydrogenedentes bacterium]|nr:hypothetical protein [Candidatus Hydrogenedentota bacterium]